MTNDKGTWAVKSKLWGDIGGPKVKRVMLESDDFEHDALLEVKGDFAGMQEWLDYAQNLADRLNAKPLADWAIFEVVNLDGVTEATTEGPRERALQEAMHYAEQYGQEGTVTVFEVLRVSLKVIAGPNQNGVDAVADLGSKGHGDCDAMRSEGERLADVDAENARLRQALDQLLDDMGPDGHCVCEDAKQQALAALGPGD